MDAKIEQQIEEVKDLLTEAMYIVEDINRKGTFFASMKMEYLEKATELIAILSRINESHLKNAPVETIYKYLYRDYKNAKAEVNTLRKDIEDLMVSKGIDEDKQALVLKLLRAEREIEALKHKNETKKEKIKRLRGKYTSKINELKARLGEEEIQEEFEDEEDEDINEPLV